MVFVLLFVVTALAIPLAVEIAKRGSDNILSRSGKEIVELRHVLLTNPVIRKRIDPLEKYVYGWVTVLGTALAVWVFITTALHLLFKFF
jgi:hypothetical protein